MTEELFDSITPSKNVMGVDLGLKGRATISVMDKSAMNNPLKKNKFIIKILF